MGHTHQKLLTAVKKYKMPSAAAELLSNEPPLIICSVTASGKNTIANYITSSTNYRETVSHTTRPPRHGEINGQHYWFVDEAKMLELVTVHVFVEVKAIHGKTIYGTSIESYKNIIGRNYKPLLVVDVQGVEEISEAAPNLRPYFLLPPSYEEWMGRLHSRGVITEKDKAERLASARREIETVLENPAYVLVVNDDIKRTANEILSGRIDNVEQAKNRQLAQNLLEHLTSNI